MATGFIGNLAETGGLFIANPRELRRIPRWLRERRAGTLELRQPWWPYDMVELVERLLPANSRVFEYGGGGSSLWLSDRGASLTVVEHDLEWSRRLRTALPSEIELIEAPPTATGTVESSHGTGYFDDYVASIDRFPGESFDLVIVDGRARVDCVLAARDKVAKNGFLLLDDSHRPRYMPTRAAMNSWHETTIRGLKVGSGIPGTTTIWKRPEF